MYKHPSGLARIIINETMHLDPFTNRHGEAYVESSAGRVLGSIGLGEGGCPRGAGFPSC